MKGINEIKAYHNRTKHHYHRYAPSLGHLDWASQPDPFRRYVGSPRILLPFMEEDTSPPYEALFAPVGLSPAPVSRNTVGQFFELSLALSAWKEFQGGRWSLRVNPSSGNLHPTEGYLAIGDLPGWEDSTGVTGKGEGMVCHYTPEDHALEIRTRFSRDVWERLADGFPEGTFFFGLTSIHWREAWKYGERAFRYCQHDVGHALAAVRLSAAALGWGVIHLHNQADSEVAALLGVDRDDGYQDLERETPDLLAAVVPAGSGSPVPAALSANAVKQVADGRWMGKANRLSRDQVPWEAIEEVSEATKKPRTESISFVEAPVCPEEHAETAPPDGLRCGSRSKPQTGTSARAIVLRRRSAVAMDGKAALSRAGFEGMLRRTLPHRSGGSGKPVPWDTVAWEANVHLVLFVHRVEGLPPGLYLLVRNPEAESALREALKKDFTWERPADLDLPLYLLAKGDCRRVAGQLSCGQEIAASGVFSLGMLAEFEDSIRRHGPWHYKRLFWESGTIGQVLYLEAEAAGLRGTGIGCFFDDPVHELLGLSGMKFQSLYHFTVGGPVEDARLTTLPPYTAQQRGHPERRRN